MTWLTYQTIAHSSIVHTHISEKYIHFALMYTNYHIFHVLPIKHLVNKYGEPTTSHNLETGTKLSLSNLRVLFVRVLYESQLHMSTQRR